MRVLLSIKPVHVANILAGTKIFEYRRRIFARQDVHTVLIYCTTPIKKIVAEFDIVGVLHDKPSKLWQRTRNGSGITKEYYEDYFAGRSEAFALQIGQVRIFEKHISPFDLKENFVAPQSYMYLPRASDQIHR
jgi:predicted transcriptional regulator